MAEAVKYFCIGLLILPVALTALLLQLLGRKHG